MTALCAGSGPSQVKAGVLANIVYAAGGAQVLAAAGGPNWLTAAAAILGVLSFETSTLCATDPPPMPVFTNADYVALLLADSGPTGHAARQKVADTVKNLAWFQSCECMSGTQPTPPASPANPGGTTYALPPPVAAGPCFSTLYTPVGLTNPNASAGPEFAIPATATAFNLSAWLTQIDPACTTNSPGWSINVYDSSHTLLHIYTQSAFVTSTVNNKFFVGPQAFPAGSAFMHVFVGAGANCPLDRFWLQVDLLCGSNSQAPASPCQADPVSVELLNQILSMVTLIQRQGVPFAYIVGAVHSGLSGNGQFAVSGLLGLKIDVTTLPARAGLVVGDPNTRFDLGWLNVGTADGFGDRMFIDTNPDVMLPVDMGAMTIVGYSIPPDVVVTISELLREP
jgi:hypothetical protein